MLKATHPMFVYHLPGLADVLEPPSLQEEAFRAAIMLPRMPPNLHEPIIDRGGWFWFDDHGPICIGPFIAFGRRQYRKSIPGGLLKVALNDAIEKWCKTNEAERCPKGMKQVLKEGVTAELLKDTMPAIRETAVMFDVVTERLYIFHASSVVRSELFNRLRKMSTDAAWQRLFGSERFSEITLQSYLEQLRPGVVLPDRLNEHFTTFLFEHAKNLQWFHLKPSDKSDSIRFGLELSHVVEMESGDVKIVAKGDTELGTVVDHAKNDTNDIPTMLKRIRIRIVVPGDRAYLVKVDDEGRSAQVHIQLPIEVSREEYDTAISADVLARATDWHYAHELMLALYRAFDALFIGPTIQKAGQTQMFPGGPAATVKPIDQALDADENAVGSPDTGGGIFSWKERLGVMYDGSDASMGVDAKPPPHPDKPPKAPKVDARTEKAHKAAVANLDNAAKDVRKKRQKRDKEAMKADIDNKARAREIADKVKAMSGVEARNYLSMVDNAHALKLISSEDTRKIVIEKCDQRLNAMKSKE